MADFDNLVHETSATTGTGNLTLVNVDGKQPFNTAFGNGATTDVFFYFISNRDAAEYEWGTGHMSAASTMVRDTVLGGSNGTSLVTFSAGTKDVTNAIPAVGLREKLLAARTYYVRTDGNDANTGLANTAGGAFLTIQKAIDTTAELDISIYDVTIQVADGTYTGAVVVSNPWHGTGTVTLQGNSGTPANVLISVTGAACITAEKNAALTVTGVKLVSSNSFLMRATSGAVITFGNIDCGATTGQQLRADDGGILTCSANYSISGGAINHWATSGAGAVIRVQTKTITITGTPAFSAFASAFIVSSIIVSGSTFSGSATGSRFTVNSGGTIYTGGEATTWLPGDAAGTGTDYGTTPFGLYA